MSEIPEYQGEYAIETRGLTRRFGSVLAVDDLDLSVAPGSNFGSSEGMARASRPPSE
jgi:ABC-type transporter Mla maintaining outer membrane lipid asymmetry ATPase subunit MlaF